MNIYQGFFWRIRIWLIKKLIGGHAMAFNLHLTRGLYVDLRKQKGGYYDGVCINQLEEDNQPDGCGMCFYSGEEKEFPIMKTNYKIK